MRRFHIQALLCSLVVFSLILLSGCSGKAPKNGGGRSRTGGEPTDSGSPPPAGREDSREAKMGAAIVDVAPGKGKGPRGGTLTAGSFDDNRDPSQYQSFFRKFSQGSVLGDLPGRFLGHHLILTVKDGAGAPVGNARVIIRSDIGNPVELLSRTDGRVIFVPGFDQIAADADFQVTVHPPGGAAPVQQVVSRNADKHTITLSAVRTSPPQELNLAIVLDTTSSMGDELEFLKAEMRSIARTIHERFPQVQKRYGLVFFRDEGDAYVTRRFDFTTSIDDVRRNLNDQAAVGGGDAPEAMHSALEDATTLDWGKGNVARVLFLISDAPPHTQHIQRTVTAVNALRKKGVAIYPVACSGYDHTTEFVMRTSALLTGGQFLFLTDDSGVGNAHAEPHLTNYHVERLDKLLIRMVASELAGKRLAPDANDILRTVGQP
jgi:von Willebrand factor type A domain